MPSPYFPQAAWSPLPGRDKIPGKIQLLTVHTAVSNLDNLYGKGRVNGGSYAHFYNPRKGRLIQYQEIGHIARADNFGNGFTISVENWDGGGDPANAPGYWKTSSDVPPLTASQVENLAQLFAWLVKEHGLPNRIATPNKPYGLGWHRLGIKGNFAPYNPADRRTWTGVQSGLNFSDSYGKICPGDRRIQQISAIYARAQEILNPQKPQKPVQKIGKEKDMFMIYRKSPDSPKIREYAIVGSNFFMSFTGESAAKNFITQLGGTPPLQVSDKFWNHCKTAAGK